MTGFFFSININYHKNIKTINAKIILKPFSFKPPESLELRNSLSLSLFLACSLALCTFACHFLFIIFLFF